MVSGAIDLYRDRAVVIGTDIARFGSRQILISQIASAHFVREVEEPHRLGNIVAMTLCLIVMLGFLLPIQADLLGYKFYMGVGLFLLLAIASGDDIVRSNAIVSYKVHLRLLAGDEIVHAAADNGQARRIVAAITAAKELAREPATMPTAALPSAALSH